MDAWVWWVVAALALGVVEVLTVDLVAVMLAGGALGGAVAAGVGAPPPVQVLVFGIVSGLLLLAVRPVASRHLRQAPHIRTGVDALPGSEAVVLERVDGADGRIKLGGEVWSARAYDGATVYEPGANVQVISISGATALVA